MELTLVDKKQETKDVFSFYFQPPSPISWQPGQFMIYSLPHQNSDVRGIMRFFTISSAPFENHITITTKIDKNNGSSFKKALMDMKAGQKIQAKGPDGNFILDNLSRDYIFIAGGVGITPFRSILTQISNQKSVIKNQQISITLFYANKSKDNILFKDELDEAKKNNPNLKIEFILNPRHIDEKTLKTGIRDFQKPVFYISGPDQMVESLVNLLETLGVQRKNIKEDYFSGYDKH